MIICSQPFRVTIGIQGRLTIQQRRVVALAIFRELHSQFRYVGLTFLRHEDGAENYRRPFCGLNLTQATTLGSRAGKLGFVVRMRRLQLGLTQAGLAENTGMSRTHLSRLERGWFYPHVDNITKFEKALGLDLAAYKYQTRLAAGAAETAGGTDRVIE